MATNRRTDLDGLGRLGRVGLVDLVDLSSVSPAWSMASVPVVSSASVASFMSAASAASVDSALSVASSVSAASMSAAASVRAASSVSGLVSAGTRWFGTSGFRLAGRAAGLTGVLRAAEDAVDDVGHGHPFSPGTPTTISAFLNQLVDDDPRLGYGLIQPKS
ncbi:hypothetical protein [Amycolatopsis magusensis]|uniref:hypothetical protein n=1 Tax=Amycolatopsis magusensis TaxID=882444 RepID=UPI0037A374B6